MRIAVTGASGLVGRALVAHLEARGDAVVRLVRRPPVAADEASWDPEGGTVDDLGRLDAIVNLAGEPVGAHRWSPIVRARILDSRVTATRTAAALAARHGCSLVNGSAVGLYGDRGDEVLTEESDRGTGFLADVVAAWEAAAAPAVDAGCRVAYARTGIVLTTRGGALERLLPLLRLGIGGPLGSGRQWWPWLTLADEVRALAFLVGSDLAGPVNLAAPGEARQGEVLAAIAHTYGRPARLPVPSLALRAVVGGFAAEVLASQRLRPARLVDAGFAWDQPDVAAAAAWLRAERG